MIGRIKHLKLTVEIETSKAMIEEVFEVGRNGLKTPRQVLAGFWKWCIENIPGCTPVERIRNG